MEQSEETAQIDNIQDVNDFLKTVLANLHSSVFVLSRERAIQSANKSGIALLGKDEKAVINQVFGNALDCMYTEGGKLQCGFTPYCKNCRLMNMVHNIFEDNQPVIKDVFDRKQIQVNGELVDKYFLYSARAIHYQQEKMVMLIVDDITKNEKQKRFLKDKNEQIYSSIRYAKHIQNALLPSKQELKSHLGEYFVIYAPKSIIGGDFYWTAEVDNITITAVGDCTGHGVPGALLTMLGIYALNDIVKGQKKTDPARILNYLRDQIVHDLNRSKSLKSEDGMDMSICAIDKDAQKIHFAGANHKIIYINSKLHEIGSNKIPVGYYTLNKEFTKQTINYQKGDIIYMFSDGYKDQFGGVNDKKLGNKRFKQLLQKMSGQKMDEQKSSLEDTFRKWKGKKEQVDDVTLLGIRLK